VDDLLGPPEAVLRLEQYSTVRAGTLQRSVRNEAAIAARRLRFRCDDGMADER
jgi:hypothetical protein